ncbi:MAG TPA: diguanylate cyclase [Sulfuricella sp.]|nr:diguanylate cyclase [Sulfuricella sp.]
MGTTHLHVMALDDDEADIELLRRYFEMLPQYEVDLVALSQPGDLLERIDTEEVDVVFLDYMLGKTTGLEVLQQLRTAGNITPVIMLTGQGDEQLAVKLMRAGATDYLGKARLSPENLSQVLRNAIRIGQLERQAVLAEEKLRLAAKVFDNALEGVVVTNAEARIVSVNPAFTAITGYSEDEVLGKNPSILCSGFQDKGFYQNMWEELLTTGQWKGEIWNTSKSGNTFLMWQTISAVKNDEGRVTHFVSVFSDITERKQREDKIRYQAYHDVLTNLPNRRLFHDRLATALLQARREGEMLAVMFLDLDHFKQVNDTLGHDVGDLLLQEVAERLKKCIRQGDTLSRFGGDEFVLLLPKIKSVRNPLMLAEKIINVFGAPVILSGRELDAKVSIGISLFPKDGDEPGALVKKADEAMYLAKQKGRNNFHLAGNAL